MSSGLETNKIVGAVLTALLVTVAIGHFGAALFGSGGHGEQVLAYPVEAGTEGPAPEPEVEVIPTVLPLMADADPAAGQALFNACISCHSAEQGGPNKQGPNLWGVFGHDIAAHPEFAYSDALLALEGEWTYDKLNYFLHAPRDYVPGTRMTYAGMPSLEDRADMIAFLQSLSDAPLPLPTQEEIEAALAADELAAGGGEDEAGDAAADEGEAVEDGAEAPDEGADAPEDEAAEGGAAEAGDDAAGEEAAPADAIEPVEDGASAEDAPEAGEQEAPAPDEADEGAAPAEEGETPAEENGQGG